MAGEIAKLKPFLKWVGGKTQLLPQISAYYPFEQGKITKYAEPFVGGGAVLFDILSQYSLEAVYINDINPALMNTYQMLKQHIDEVIAQLDTMKKDFLSLDAENRKRYFYMKRDRFNQLMLTYESVEKAALMIFLNKTCFNGLYRVNKKGLFNVPMGAYKNPSICDEENLRKVSLNLQKVNMFCGDYHKLIDLVDNQTFVYLDPPYRPLNATASFTAYAENGFDDEAQKVLADFISHLSQKGAVVLLSNSDPKNEDGADDFFDLLYQDYSIRRIEANRTINSKGNKRGKIKELLVSNVRLEQGDKKMKRQFEVWLGHFRESIANYQYYVDFNKVYHNADKIKVELNILNSLLGSQTVEADFEELLAKYPEILKCIPILLAVRANEIYAMDEDGGLTYNFKEKNLSIEQYKVFMRKTGLFHLIQYRIINNLVDYVLGVETGLDSNGRKNRGGHLMEDLLERFIQEAGFIKEISYFKEMTISQISRKWHIDLSAISNQGKTEKRFDFVIKTDKSIYAVETNFYGSGGSKLNETARSYKNLTLEARTIEGFNFMWFTDGKGWFSARHNLEETFDVLPHLYNIQDLENGILKEVLN